MICNQTLGKMHGRWRNRIVGVLNGMKFFKPLFLNLQDFNGCLFSRRF